MGDTKFLTLLMRGFRTWCTVLGGIPPYASRTSGWKPRFSPLQSAAYLLTFSISLLSAAAAKGFGFCTTYLGENGLAIEMSATRTRASLPKVVDDEVRTASGLSYQITLSFSKRRGFNIHMQSCCCIKIIHIVLNSIIMTLHEGFLCLCYVEEEHVLNIEVINPLPAVEFPGTASQCYHCHLVTGKLRAQVQWGLP